MTNLLSLTPNEISGIISGVAAGLVSIIGAVGAIINERNRRTCDKPKCCLTGRDLKPKKAAAKKKIKAS